MVYREGLNIGYRHFTSHDVPVLFPFGHGLSYTQFSYSDAALLADWSADSETVEVAVTVTNSGDKAGAEVVQLYVRDVEATPIGLDRELKAFQKISLAAGESRQVQIYARQARFCVFRCDAR